MNDEALLSLELPSRPAAAGAARKALTALNGSLHLVSEERLTDAQLLISELVSNAVRHGPGGETPVRLNVYADDNVMRVEVRDGGAGFDPERVTATADPGSERFGLRLIAMLAHRWGTSTDDGSLTWFEIDRPQKSTPLEADPVDGDHQ